MEMKAFSFFFLLTIFFFFHSAPNTFIECTKNISTDQSTLIDLKNHFVLVDPDNALARNWSSTVPVCNWIGVTCGSHHHRVIALNISGMRLSGQLPASLGNLSFLSLLDMSHNLLYGNIPKELGHLQRLKTLLLPTNNLTGQIPQQLGNLHRLEGLDMSTNNFVGSIPSSIFNISTLQSINLNLNGLSGTLPNNLCGNIPNLIELYLDRNRLSGPLPTNLSSCSWLQSLVLRRNEFTGFLPRGIGGLEMLRLLDLGLNRLTGEIPQEFGNLRNLRILNLRANQITGVLPKAIFNLTSLQLMQLLTNNLIGSIPREIGNLTSIQELDLYENSFSGTIPQEVRRLNEVEVLDFHSNNLSGLIPEVIFNITTLRIIDLSMNQHWGSLPSTIGHALPNLEQLYISETMLSGVIPQSLSNCSQLSHIILGFNYLIGSIPKSLGDLRLLSFFSVVGNGLSSESSSPELSFIASLTNCRELYILDLSLNDFHGVLPKSIGNFSSSLHDLGIAGNGLRGSIRGEIGNLSGLQTIEMTGNELGGIIPDTLKGLQRLERLYLGNNKLRGPLPSSLCKLEKLGLIYLMENQISGPIPECLGNLISLRYIHLRSNRLMGRIPPNLWSMKDLLELDLCSNSLSGALSPDIGNLKAITLMCMSENQFSGTIPSTLGSLQNLISLLLAKNNLNGQIPETIAGMLSLESLDLSHNNLSGPIPMSLQALKYLVRFNVSFNRLRGEIPSNGSFRNFTRLSFMNNEALCGAPRFHVPPCPSISAQRSNNGKRIHRFIYMALGIIASFVVLVVGLVIVVCQKKMKGVRNENLVAVRTVERVTYYELMEATNGYNDSNVVGVGSFGVVYKGVLEDGRNIAVKVFKLQQEEFHSTFEAECKVLCNIRHRNLTKVLSCCSNPDFKALVLEYMPNGSFEKWLYSENHFLDMKQRLDIMIDVASALEYLHHNCSAPVVHCDLKPSNVLLDEHMIAHVSDFGIAKLLNSDDGVLHTRTLATLGYIAPEYGSKGLVSTRCDVYSYGIMLIEAFTRKKPDSEMFFGNVSLRSWVQESLPNRVIDVIDADLVAPSDANFSAKVKCLSSIMELALNCSVETPIERMNMKDVHLALHKIKLLLLTN